MPPYLQEEGPTIEIEGNEVQFPRDVVPIEQWREIYGEDPVATAQREVWRRSDLKVVHDPRIRDTKAEAFRQQCREETHALQMAVEAEFRERGLPLYGRHRKRPSALKGVQKILFNIGPPLVVSPAECQQKKGLTPYSESHTMLMIHRGMNGVPQGVRRWRNQRPEWSALAQSVAADLNGNLDALGAAHGDWAEMARIIVDRVECYYQLVQLVPSEGIRWD